MRAATSAHLIVRGRKWFHPTFKQGDRPEFDPWQSAPGRAAGRCRTFTAPSSLFPHRTNPVACGTAPFGHPPQLGTGMSLLTPVSAEEIKGAQVLSALTMAGFLGAGFFGAWANQFRLALTIIYIVALAGFLIWHLAGN